MRNPVAFGSLPTIAIGLLLIIFPASLVSQVTEPIFSYPVGSVAMFPQSAGHRLINAENIHLRALGRDGPVWDVDPVTIPLPEQQSPNTFIKQTAIGFIVPQLPRGGPAGIQGWRFRLAKISYLLTLLGSSAWTAKIM